MDSFFTKLSEHFNLRRKQFLIEITRRDVIDEGLVCQSVECDECPGFLNWCKGRDAFDIQTKNEASYIEVICHFGAGISCLNEKKQKYSLKSVMLSCYNMPRSKLLISYHLLVNIIF